MKCSNLIKNAQVVFKADPFHEGHKMFYDGTVIYVLNNVKKVCVSYLCGYQNYTDDIPYEDMIACYDENGEMMKFGGIRGKSQLLIPE